MSRSYRKPCFTDNLRGSKKAKIVHNRKLRKLKDIGQNSNYKKQNETWDIHDYKHIAWKSFEHSCWYKTKEKVYLKQEYEEMVAKAKRK